jgi:hypothetical protein
MTIPFIPDPVSGGNSRDEMRRSNAAGSDNRSLGAEEPR